jgi:hypothetical protein
VFAHLPFASTPRVFHGEQPSAVRPTCRRQGAGTENRRPQMKSLSILNCKEPVKGSSCPLQCTESGPPRPQNEECARRCRDWVFA